MHYDGIAFVISYVTQEEACIVPRFALDAKAIGRIDTLVHVRRNQEELVIKSTVRLKLLCYKIITWRKKLTVCLDHYNASVGFSLLAVETSAISLLLFPPTTPLPPWPDRQDSRRCPKTALCAQWSWGQAAGKQGRENRLRCSQQDVVQNGPPQGIGTSPDGRHEETGQHY